MRERREAGTLDAREILQVLIVALGWIGFVWLWVLVGRQPWDSSSLVWLILGSLVVLPVVTLVWVIHNRSLFKRKGERRGVAPADLRYPADWNGRRVDADWAALRASSMVSIDVAGPVKTYRDTAVAAAGVAAAPIEPSSHAWRESDAGESVR